jgi:hypothetical protein
MAKLLTTASFVTQSFPATPSSGYGTLYASGSSLYYKNSSGIDYDLSIVGSSSIQIYTGSATWTKPTNIQYIKVICGGAGGGGGGGRVGPDGGTRAGGEGGAGGDIAIAYFSSASLTGTTYSVNVPGGGPGGTRATGNAATSGGSGVAPGTSSFSTGSTILLAALGGPRGRGGGVTGGVGSVHVVPTTTNTPNPYPPFYLSGRDGGVDTGLGYGDSGDALNGVRWLSGGGTGGRLFAGNTPSRGGSGSAIYRYTTLIPSGSPGPGGGTGLSGSNGAPVVDVLTLLYASGSIITSSVFIGTGGHGGGSGNSPAPFTTNGGNGGSGSLGAGGGGGGAAGTGLNTIFSGAGGPGGGGFVIIFEYY